MNIFVCIKQVPDTETKIELKSDNTYIETKDIKWIMNPYDEFALEQALLIKDHYKTGINVIAVRVGATNPSTEVLRTALAMGADEAILVDAKENLPPYPTALALKRAIDKSQKPVDLILAGKQSIDYDNFQVPQMLAQMFEFPSISQIVSFNLTKESAGSKALSDGSFFKVELKREIEGGTIEIYNLELPVCCSCNKGLNVPRYPSLPGIMKAKKKNLITYSLQDLDINDNDKRIEYRNFYHPPEKAPGKKYTYPEGDANKGRVLVEEVFNLLKNEAKVIGK
ncbi:MAG: electron transfer flavoprotein subunit beta/FixA family protein [Oligoflexia bacterium]|nr:electron transfer flavoprotein subunit beta/FixA family protein [Oligoflexia bacterium]